MEICKSRTINRSRLFYLPPIYTPGAGIESLTGYIARLAEAHCMTTGELVAKEVTPVINKPYLTNIALYGGTRFYENASMVNGLGETAKAFTAALELLTWRQDLSKLTLLRLRSGVPDRYLCRKEKQWCPLCLCEWATTGQEIYEPLLWGIQAVNICPVHEVVLQNNCGRCGEIMRILDRRAKVGHCTKCGTWLGGTIKMLKKTDGNAVSLNIARKIKTVLNWKCSLDKEKLIFFNRNLLERCINEYFDGNMAGFAKCTAYSKTSVWEWMHEKNMPTLSTLSELACLFQTDIADWITDRNVSVHYQAAESVQRNCSRRVVSLKDWQGIETELEQLILATERDDVRPMSLNEIAKSLGICTKGIKTHFPVQHEQLSERYRKWQSWQKEQRLIAQKERLLQTIRILNGDQIYPSRRKVESLSHLNLRKADLQEFWKNSLGFKGGHAHEST